MGFVTNQASYYDQAHFVLQLDGDQPKGWPRSRGGGAAPRSIGLTFRSRALGKQRPAGHGGRAREAGPAQFQSSGRGPGLPRFPSFVFIGPAAV